MAGTVLALGALTACQKDDGGGGSPLVKGGGGKGGSVPERLVGVWTTGSGSTINYKDAITGAYAPPSGSTGELTIKSDGSYTENGLLQTTLYNCTTSLFVMEEGRASVSDDKITFKPSKVKTSMQDTCRKGSNFNNRDGTKNTKSDTFELTEDEYGPLLRLTDDTGAASDYRPKKT